MLETRSEIEQRCTHRCAADRDGHTPSFGADAAHASRARQHEVRAPCATAAPPRRRSGKREPSPAACFDIVQRLSASGGRTSSAAKRCGRCRKCAMTGTRGRAVCWTERNVRGQGPRFDADRRNASRAPVRGDSPVPDFARRVRLADAAGLGDGGSDGAFAVRLERHLAALSCCGAAPGSRSRYIPRSGEAGGVAARPGYVAATSTRTAGGAAAPRYRLEIDHIVPFAARRRCGAGRTCQAIR